MPRPAKLAAEPQVLAGRRIGDQYQARHSWFEYDRIERIQMHDDPFADAADIANPLSHNPAAKMIDPRHDRNGPRARTQPAPHP